MPIGCKQSGEVRAKTLVMNTYITQGQHSPLDTVPTQELAIFLIKMLELTSTGHMLQTSSICTCIACVHRNEPVHL